MWPFLTGIFIGRATGLWRYMRFILVLFAIGLAISTAIYMVVVLHAVNERNQAPHVQHHSSQ